MSLLFLDGFECQYTHGYKKWNGPVYIEGYYTYSSDTYPKRTSGKSIPLGANNVSWISTNVTPSNTIIIGAAFRTSEWFSSSSSIKQDTYFSLTDDQGYEAVNVQLDYTNYYLNPATSKFSIYRNYSTLIESKTYNAKYTYDANLSRLYLDVPGWGIWNYMELKVYIHPTAGSYEFRINGYPVLSGNNVRTRHTSSTSSNISRCMIGPIQTAMNTTFKAEMYIDDCYICNTSGTSNNNFLGTVRVDELKPNGIGTYSQWTPSTGSNYTCVDDTSMDTTDYVQTSTLDNKDSYAFANISSKGVDSSATINAVNQNFVAKRKDYNVPSKVKVFCRISGVDYEAPVEFTLTNDYQCYFYIWEKSPATNSAWTKSEVDNAEFGTKLSATS